MLTSSACDAGVENSNFDNNSTVLQHMTSAANLSELHNQGTLKKFLPNYTKSLMRCYTYHRPKKEEQL